MHATINKRLAAEAQEPLASSSITNVETPEKSPPWADKKLTSKQRADLGYRYQDWLLTMKVPKGGFRLLYAISQCFNKKTRSNRFPRLNGWRSALGKGHRPSGRCFRSWKDRRDRDQMGQPRQRPSEHLPAARGVFGILFRTGKGAAAAP